MVGKPLHLWSMTSLMSQAHKELKHLGWDVIITYADPIAKHNGTVYKAGNWIENGTSSTEKVWLLDDKRCSRRSFYDRHGTQSVRAMKAIYGDRLKILPGKPKQRFFLGISKRGKKFIRLIYIKQN